MYCISWEAWYECKCVSRRFIEQFVYCLKFLSVNIPRWVAMYLDLSTRSITCFFRVGDSSLFVSILASYETFVVTCSRLSWKSSMGLICNLSILYDLFGGGCLMDRSSSFIAWIWHISRCVFALLVGFPYPRIALVASHFVVSNYSHVYLQNKCSFLICVGRFSKVPVVFLRSYVYPWSSYAM